MKDEREKLTMYIVAMKLAAYMRLTSGSGEHKGLGRGKEAGKHKQGSQVIKNFLR
jgi:hypothetical protein